VSEEIPAVQDQLREGFEGLGSILERMADEMAGAREMAERDLKNERQESALELRRLLARDPRPVKMSGAKLVCAIPGLAQRFKPIPDEFWIVDGDETEVSCPCGESPRMAMGGMIVCKCERAFVRTRNRVMVANSPDGAGDRVGALDEREQDASARAESVASGLGEGTAEGR
jgi:hypothetical protein